MILKSIRVHAIALMLLAAAATASGQEQNTETVKFSADGSVTSFFADMRMVTAHRLPSSGTGVRRYISEEFGENSYADHFACAYVLSVIGNRNSVMNAARTLGVDSAQVAMYSVSAECFSFNGAEVDRHLYDANANGWQLEGGWMKITGEFRPEDPARDVAAFQYVIPRYRAKAEEFQREHPDDPSNMPAVIHKANEPGMKPPVLIHSTDAEFTQDARSNHIQGMSVVSLIVSPEGLPENLVVTKRLGHGLDESAIAAVQTYRFRPATLNGVPVPIAITIEVNFHFYSK